MLWKSNAGVSCKNKDWTTSASTRSSNKWHLTPVVKAITISFNQLNWFWLTFWYWLQSHHSKWRETRFVASHQRNRPTRIGFVVNHRWMITHLAHPFLSISIHYLVLLINEILFVLLCDHCCRYFLWKTKQNEINKYYCHSEYCRRAIGGGCCLRNRSVGKRERELELERLSNSHEGL